jgi:hypothetical protein
MNAGTSTMQSTASDNSGQVYIAANAYGAYGYRNLACTDTDNSSISMGNSFFTKGYVTGKDIFGNIYIKEPDYCRANNSSVLVEYSCQFNYVNKTEYNCQWGCNDGACKRCAPGTLLNGNGNQCISCNAKGTAYVPDDSKCPKGTHCISIISLTEVGKCLAQQMCIPGSVQPETNCNICNSAGTAYVGSTPWCQKYFGQSYICAAGKCVQPTNNLGIPAGSTIPVANGKYFLLGVNYPWVTYAGDFGSGKITAGSVYEQNIKVMRTYGARVVRWWVFTNGMMQPTFSNGVPTGVNASFYNDMDTAISLAKKYDVYLVPVLFNGDIVTSHSSLFDNGSNTQAFITNVAEPIMKHYPNEPRILAWEVFSEPEGAIGDGPLGVGPWYTPTITASSFYTFTNKVCNAVHTYTKSYCTVGSSSIDNLKFYTASYAAANGLQPMNLDFYEAHYYGYGSSIYTKNYTSLNLDHPVVIEEVAGTTVTVANMDKIFDNGYAGYWPWGFSWGTISINWTEYTTWAKHNNHPDVVNIISAYGT